MKTSDGRFIEKRIQIPKNMIKKIIMNIKVRNNFTWKNFSKVLGVSEQTLRIDWILKKNTIPESIFKKLIDLDESLKLKDLSNKIKILKPFWGQAKGGDSSKKKFDNFIVLPNKKSEDFAEFYGIMLGDGCIYSNLNGFCITGNSVSDKVYYEDYLKKLIYNLFKIEPRIYYSKQSNTIRCALYSKKITKFLLKNDFPSGKKRLGNAKIPNFIINNDKLIIACIRGLNDTDGCVSLHPNSKIMIHISITIPPLLESCKKAFKKLSFNVGSYNKGINMYGKSKVKQFFDVIGSSNPKHITRYNNFLDKIEVRS